MSPTVEISDSALASLNQLAGPLFTASDVIERLVASALTQTPSTTGSTAPATLSRLPRERGISLILGETRIDAVSVPDLYRQFLEWLVETGLNKKLDSALPVRTSNQRHLISKVPKHPGGNHFKVPIEHRGYFMEAHKNYENAVSGLSQLGKLLGVGVKEVAR